LAFIEDPVDMVWFFCYSV